MYPYPAINPLAYPQPQLGAGFQSFASAFPSVYSALSQPPQPQVNPMASSQPNVQPTSSASTSSSVEATPIVSTQPIAQPTNTNTSVTLGSFQANSYPYPYTSPFPQSTNTASSYPMLAGNPLVNISIPATRAATAPATTTTTSYYNNYYTLIEKQKVFHHLIESLKSNENCDAIEAEIKYNHLHSLYQSYVSTEAGISSYLRGTNFTNRMKNAEQFQREVIALQVSLKKIMKNESSSPVPNPDDQTGGIKKSDSTNVASSSSASNANPSTEQIKPMNAALIKTEKIDCPKSNSDPKPTATETAKTHAEVLAAFHKQQLDEFTRNLQSDGTPSYLKQSLSNALLAHKAAVRKSLIDAGKSNDKSNMREASQANESANKSGVSTTEEFEILSKPNETDDQAKLVKQPENGFADAVIEQDAVLKDLLDHLSRLLEKKD